MPYSNNPATSNVDAVRFWLQDKSATAPMLTDVEIQYVISTAGTDSPIEAAAVACSALIAKYAGQTSISADGVSISYEALQDKYRSLAATLRYEARRLAGQGVAPTFGETISTSAGAPQFGLGMHDNPGAGRQGVMPDYYDDPAIDPAISGY